MNLAQNIIVGICSKYNRWNSTDKAAHLRASLVDGAATLLWQIEEISYEAIVEKLRSRYGNREQQEKFTLKIGKAFSTSLHLWFCIRIPITIVIGLPKSFKHTDDPTIVFVVQINDMIALFIILFILIVSGKFARTPHMLCD